MKPPPARDTFAKLSELLVFEATGKAVCVALSQPHLP
jgi:hypothetical protein